MPTTDNMIDHPEPLAVAWQSLLDRILYSGFQDNELVEVRHVPVRFTASSADSAILEKAGLEYTLHEMRKVFFTEEPNDFGHSYRRFWRGPLGRDDLSDVIELLANQPSTKRAVLTMVDPDGRKVPCVNIIQFLVRNERLETIYFARAQDAYRKFCADSLCILEFAQRVAEPLSLAVGSINGTIGSAHIYIEDLPSAREIAHSKNFL